jgi:hypothetical protein
MLYFWQNISVEKIVRKIDDFIPTIAIYSYTALAAWHSGKRVHLQNRRSRVRIQPGCKVLRNLYSAVLLS